MASSRATPGTCHFILSTDLTILVRCRVDRLLPPSRAEALVCDEPLDVEVDLVLDGEVFRTLQSSQAVFDASPEHGQFRPQHFVFAMKVRDLPRQCSFIIWLRTRESPSQCYRGVLPLFNRRAVLRQGNQLLALTLHDDPRLSEGSPAVQAGEEWAQHSNEAVLSAGPPELEEALRLASAVDLYSRGCLPPAMAGFEGSEDFFARKALDALEASGIPWLSVQLPVFQHAIVFAEPQYDQDTQVPTGLLAPPLREDSGGSLAALDDAGWLLQPLRPVDDRDPKLRHFKCLVDYDAHKEHPAVIKAGKLARLSRSSRAKDRDARPDAAELLRLNELIRRPRRQFSTDERHLLQRFRWSLTEQPGALTKFLHSVDWSDLEERRDAIELLHHWSPVDIDDALELLSKDFRGSREVRRHAVERLEKASDADLELYLLQLVQALRYEPAPHEVVDDTTMTLEPETTPGESPSRRQTRFGSGGSGGVEIAPRTLTEFLISRALRCGSLATRLYWYLTTGTEDRERGALFLHVLQLFWDALGESPEFDPIKKSLERQVALRTKLLWSSNCAKVNKRDRMEKKVERLRQALVMDDPDQEVRLDLVGGLEEGIPLPVDPTLMLHRVLVEKCIVLKSAMVPALITCEVSQIDESGGPAKKFLKKIMVKEGDDLRQDQLILQLIILMDSILKKYGLDLQLTPYQVVALSMTDGIIEIVDATNLSAVLKDNNNDIQQFLRNHHPQETKADGKGGDSSAYGAHNSYGIKPEVLDNFIRSSAGYCVITYILGIGDRHLDNLMVTNDGHLFHIDFGFILGKDPKPFTAPMRICKEMVEGMGGSNSPGYKSFKTKCCQAYKILRRHSKLIINLLYLMTDSGIKDLTGDPHFAILKVEQKFQALMDDEQAEEYFLNLIDESVSALFPGVWEKLHKISIAMQ